MDTLTAPASLTAQISLALFWLDYAAVAVFAMTGALAAARSRQDIVTFGFFAAITGFVSADALRKAVLDSVPPHTRDLNAKAFEAGFEYGKSMLAGAVQEPVTA